MSLIGIIADRDCGVEILNLSEVHYILRPNYSYITIEFAVTASEAITKFILCIHGHVETSKDKIKQLETTRSYAKLFRLSDCDLTASNGIYDFRDTWGIDAITNQCYEGPAAFNQVSVRVTGQQIVYYGCLAYIPETTYESENLDSCTLVNISRKDGSDFEKDSLYVFRLGFFLEWPKELLQMGFLRPLRQFIRGSVPVNYSVHTLSRPPEAEAALRKRTDIKDRLEKSSLCIDLSPFINRYAKENTDNPEICIHDRWADEPTSDLWIVIPHKDDLDIASELLEGITELLPSTVKYGLFTHQSTIFSAPFKEYHIKYKRNIRPLMGHKCMKITQQIASQLPRLWRIRMWNFDLRSWLSEAIKNVGILAILLALSLVFTWQHGYLLPVYIGLIILYLVVILAMGLSRNTR